MIVKRGGSFTPAPEGVHDAVCVDVVDLGMIDGMWGTQPKIRLAWELEETMPDGRRYIASKRYTPSLHEKATLAKDLRSWRGRPFTAEELAGFELDNVIGAPCKLVIQHDERDGNVYANVVTIMKATKKLAPSGDYVRVKDREKQPEAADHSHKVEEPAAEEEFEDFVPF